MKAIILATGRGIPQPTLYQGTRIKESYKLGILTFSPVESVAVIQPLVFAGTA